MSSSAAASPNSSAQSDGTAASPQIADSSALSDVKEHGKAAAPTAMASTAATADVNRVERAEFWDVPGMVYCKGVISGAQETKVWDWLYSDQTAWQPGPGASRRVQQFGHAYDYNTKTIARAPPIPAVLQELIADLQGKGLLNKDVNQIIVNEYVPGQGITPHTDHPKWFGDQISSLTLRAGCSMVLRSDLVTRSVYLEPRSLLILSGPARWKFMHSIPARKSDMIRDDQDQIVHIPRQTRVSITFRHVFNNPANNTLTRYFKNQ